jgi:hypothetical protein
MIIGTWQDEAWTFYDKVTGEIMGDAERQKEVWERLDHLVLSLADGREEFRELLFKLSSNGMNTEAIKTRDLVRRWLSINDPDGGYRLTR